MSTESSLSSGRLTADTAIAARPAKLYSVILEGDGTNACDVTIYDNATTNSGTVLAKILLRASAEKTYVFEPAFPIEALKGIYADVTGTGAAFIIHYGLM